VLLALEEEQHRSNKLVPARRDRAQEFNAARVKRVNLLPLGGCEARLPLAFGRHGLHENQHLHQHMAAKVAVAQLQGHQLRRGEELGEIDFLEDPSRGISRPGAFLPYVNGAASSKLLVLLVVVTREGSENL
jgi:hypothetical protein